MQDYNFLEKENVSGKTVIIRVDLNSSVEDGELFESARLEKHSQTLKSLSEKGAKVVALAHQGRKGQEDCISLKQHAEAISEAIEKEVKLVSWEAGFEAEIRQMQAGDIVLMENVRFRENEEQEFSKEEAAKIEWVQKMAGLAQLFVQDALSVCHRAQPSVIGFSNLPSFAGPVLRQELEALKKFDEAESPKVFVLGGAKVKDSLALMQSLFERGKADTICVGGLLGELFLKAKGLSLGAKEKFLEEKGLLEFIEKAKQLLEQNPGKVVLPVDLAVMNISDEREEISVAELPRDDPIYDIGLGTVAEFKERFKKAKFIAMNGPMGVFEKMDFETGTKKVFEAISKARAFSLIGGGDTEAALQQLDIPAQSFSHVSLAGKALLKYLSGKELPGLTALQK